jgi:UDP-glucose 4-epimerase
MPSKMPITEDLPQNPINPYGDSKLMVEHILKDVAKAEGLAFAAPRYFNVAGSSLDGTIGEDHRPESHIIPALLAVALGKRTHMDLFGTDYPTPDGTCVRDYIHVWDLVEAHLILLENIKPGKGLFYNLGVGKGYSNRQIIDACRRVTGKEIKIVDGPRRAGDPPELYANADKIKNELGWQAKITDLDQIVATAWKWIQAHPNGYE